MPQLEANHIKQPQEINLIRYPTEKLEKLISDFKNNIPCIRAGTPTPISDHDVSSATGELEADILEMWEFRPHGFIRAVKAMHEAYRAVTDPICKTNIEFRIRSLLNTDYNKIHHTDNPEKWADIKVPERAELTYFRRILTHFSRFRDYHSKLQHTLTSIGQSKEPTSKDINSLIRFAFGCISNYSDALKKYETYTLLEFSQLQIDIQRFQSSMYLIDKSLQYLDRKKSNFQYLERRKSMILEDASKNHPHLTANLAYNTENKDSTVATTQ